MTKEEREIDKLITIAERLSEETRSLYRNLYKHDPEREIRNPPPLTTLMSNAGHIAYRAVSLREEIRRVLERRQIDELESKTI